MARNAAVKIEQDEPVSKSTIPDVAGLKREYLNARVPMPERKVVALRTKLIALYKEGKITEEEQELMETILKRERNLGKIHSSDNYLLNTIEVERLTDKCIVKTEDAPVVHHLKKDLECKYVYDPDYNDGKNKKDSVGRYYVYVPRIVPSEHQLSVKTVLKIERGHPTDESDFPPERVLIHRLALKRQEFFAWFEVEDEDILKTKPIEPEYVF